MSMSAEGSSLYPESFFTRVFERCCTLFYKQSAPLAPYTPGLSDGKTDTYTSVPEPLPVTASINSALIYPSISATEPRSTPTGIRPASHFQQRTDITGSSVISGSPVLRERLHRSATSPSATSPPSATDITGSSLTGRVSTSFAFPNTTATAPKDPTTSATAPDVNPITLTRQHRLPVIADYVESPSNSAQSTNESSAVEFIYTPPGYRLVP